MTLFLLRPVPSHISRLGLLALSLSLTACSLESPADPVGGAGSVSLQPEGVRIAWMATVQARLRDGSHAFIADRGQAGGFHAEVPERRLRASFDVGGVRLTGAAGGRDAAGAAGAIHVRSARFGRTAALEESVMGEPVLGDCIAGMAEPSGACVRRLEYASPGLTEWWKSTPEGFEQGWTVDAPPGGEGELAIDIAVDGASVVDAGDSLWLQGDDRLIAVRDLWAFDAAGRQLDARFVPSESGFQIVVDDDGAAYPIEIDPVYTTDDWTISGVDGATPLASAVSGAGDVNNDGYDDVLVAASAWSTNTGRVFVYPGSSAGLSDVAATTLDGSASGDFFGRSVSTAGDVNGDGYDDILIGADGYSTSTGVAYVFLGSATGTSTTASTTLAGSASTSFGYSVSGAGDVNNDGYDDVIVGAYAYGSYTGRAYVYRGSSTGLSSAVSSTLTGPSASGSFGWSVSRAGDVNNDGYSDVIVGAYNDNSTGRAYVYHGASTGLSTTATATLAGTTASDLFGYVVAPAGDVNDDGYDDVIVTATKNSTYGSVYVYHGASTGVSSTATTRLTGVSYNFGVSVAGIGDSNSDGYADIIVGCDGAGTTSTGAAYLYQGTAAGVSGTVSVTMTGEGTLNYFGHTVAAAGDVNGDSYSDVLVGAYGYSSSTGRAYVYEGTVTGMPSVAATTITEPDEALGTSVNDLGDVNGDGFADVIVGVPGYDSAAGQALIFHGSASGLAATADATLVGETEGDRFGHAVSGAGDVNGDGFKDVLIGAYDYDSTALGRVYVYEGSSSGVGTTASQTLTGSDANGNLGYAVSGCGDINGDGYDDVMAGASGYSTSTGKVYFYNGSSAGTSSVPTGSLTGAGTNYGFGRALSRAGDVNNDGYDDVVIGAPSYNSRAGRAYVYHGSSSGIAATASLTLTGSTTSVAVGASVSSASDVNNDGYDDIIVGSPGYNSGFGRAYVYHGSSSGVSGTATTTITGTSVSYLGYSVSSAGDVDRDGFPDVVVGAYGASSSAGSVSIYPGSGLGVSTTAMSTLTGDAASQFGFSVSGAGDVDGDGYQDVIVGASTGGGSASLYRGYADVDGDGVGAVDDCDDTDATVGSPVTNYADLDGDGFGDPAVSVSACTGTAGYVTDDSDCDDADSAINPDATEVCDASGVDEDCDGFADDDDTAATGKTTVYTDGDGDGYGSGAVTFCDVPATGYADNATDCDDSESAIHPGGSEVCDSANNDEDCSGAADNDDASATGASLFYADADADGYGGDVSVSMCDAEAGYTSNSADCDDSSSAVSPAAREVCDAADVDEDCDGLSDDADSSTTGETTFYADADSDGYGGSTSASACEMPSGYVSSSTDCDDTDANVSPAEVERCDASDTDEDCNGLADNSDPAALGTTSYYVDADGDTYGSTSSTDVCDAGSGYSTNATDCNDADASAHPGGTEVLADGKDGDCDGTETCYVDADGDAYKSASTVVSADGDCSDSGEALSSQPTDCDDSDGTINAGEAEVVGDGVDSDCDGTELCYVDVDADGYRPDDATTVESTDDDCSDLGEADDSIATGDCDDSDSDYNPDAAESDCHDPNDYNCDGVTGYVDGDGDGFAACDDCDDTDRAVNEDAVEVCNGYDDNCDSVTDTDAVDQTEWYADADGDGYTVVDGSSVTSCDAPAGYAAETAEDCDDTSAAYHPGASESDCNDPNDYNCDGSVGFVDGDFDGVAACEDCDDEASSVYPGATEYCNNKDDDCDSAVDEDAVDETEWYADADSDGYTDLDLEVVACDAPAGYIEATADDCDDNSASTNPAATDIPGDGVDQDCNGTDAAGDDTGDTDTSADSDADSDTDTATDTATDTDTDAGDTGDLTETKTGCACASGSGDFGWAALLVGVAVVGRRRRA